MPRKDFTDERVSKKQRQIDKKRRKQDRKEVNKALKQSKKDGTGWTTRDGQQI